jgi:hypothetical protein
VSQPDCGETALQIVDELARSQAVQIIAIDSVSALVPRSEIDGEIGALQVGGRDGSGRGAGAARFGGGGRGCRLLLLLLLLLLLRGAFCRVGSL